MIDLTEAQKRSAEIAEKIEELNRLIRNATAKGMVVNLDILYQQQLENVHDMPVLTAIVTVSPELISAT